MAMLELPHTTGCLVCGRDNPLGLKLRLFVDDATGVVETRFTPSRHHIGFEGITHGGVLATVLDEVMVWAATWAGRRFCVCAELTTRFRKVARSGVELRVAARVVERRARLITTTAEVTDGSGTSVIGSAKYMPVSAEEHLRVCSTFVADPKTFMAAGTLRPA